MVVMALVDSGEVGASGKPAHCCSCGISLEWSYELYTCAKCGLTFCSSCQGLKLKLAYMNGRPPGPDGSCMACRLLQKTDKQGKPKSSSSSNVGITKDTKMPKITGQNDDTKIGISDKSISKKKTNSLGHENNTNSLECQLDKEVSQILSIGTDKRGTDLAKDSAPSKMKDHDIHKSELTKTKENNFSDRKNDRNIFENNFQKIESESDSQRTSRNFKSDGKVDERNTSSNSQQFQTLSSSSGQAAVAVDSCKDSSSKEPLSVLPSSSSSTMNFDKNEIIENDNFALNPYKDVSGLNESGTVNAWSNIFEPVTTTSDIVGKLDSNKILPNTTSYELTFTTGAKMVNFKAKVSAGDSVKEVTLQMNRDNPHFVTSRVNVQDVGSPAAQSDVKSIMGAKTKMSAGGASFNQPGDICPGCGRPECTGNRYMILLRQLIKVVQRFGLEVRDVVSDGNCMFTAVIDQLSCHSDSHYTLQSLRKATVDYLRDNPESEDGTHFSEFLTSETWEQYLKRMEKDGEWGDHMSLRAIAEVTQRTIQVISAEEGRDWTVIEPNSAGEDKLSAIYLGHVGEFHYVSLRPSVHWKSLESHFSKEGGEGDASLQVQDNKSDADVGHAREKEGFYGSESVEMFKENYLDPWTELPVAHFSFALKRIFPHKFMQPAETWSMRCLQFTDYVDFGPGFDKYIMGSIPEGFYIPGIDKPTPAEDGTSEMTVITFLGVERNVAVYPEGHKNYKVTDLFYETKLVHPGYLHVVGRIGGWGSASTFLPSSEYRVRGQTEKYSIERNRIAFKREMDVVLSCAVWPSVAEQWQHRPRPVNWPKHDIIQKVVSEGCFIGPNPHPSSTNPNIEWQFLFSAAEKTLALEALSKHQKYCYILFKAMFSCFLKEYKIISSGHLKSIFFHACEFIPESLWSGNPGACLLYLIEQLRSQIEDRNIPNYFIPENNMIDHFSEKMFQDIQQAVMRFRTQPLSAVNEIAINNHITISQTVIETILDDVPSFREHQSVRESTLTVFLPQTIKQIQGLVYRWKIKDALELASEAYEERLAVSTCSDSVPFQIFMSQVVMNMTVQGQWWFCYYADKLLGLSLVQELSLSIPTVRLGDLVGDDVAGTEADLFVPVAIATNTINFCSDFARELNHDAKFSKAQPYLHYCMKKFKEIKEENVVPLQNEDGYESEYELTRKRMLEVYWLAFCCYKALDQMAFFQELMPEIQELCVDINSETSSRYLSNFLDGIEDFQKLHSFYEGSGRTTAI